MNEMNPLLKVAIDAARSAGIVIMEEYENPTVLIKDDGSPVTRADTRAHEVLMEALGKTGHPILSEEADAGTFSYSDAFWIIDPVDGTRDFIAKTGDFAVMIAFIEHGRPTLGVVYAPAQEKLYFAEKGQGSFLEIGGETQRLHVEKRAENLTCIRSVHHFNEQSASVVKALGATEIPHGSIGIKSGLIAEQVGDFSFSFGKLGEWDVAGPEIILTEAGGSATDTDGDPFTYGNSDHRIQKGAAFSNGTCHDNLLIAMRNTLV